MDTSIPMRLLLLGVFLVIPLRAFAQEAVLSGTVADSTGAVLPGVTVTVVHEGIGGWADSGIGNWELPPASSLQFDDRMPP